MNGRIMWADIKEKVNDVRASVAAFTSGVMRIMHGADRSIIGQMVHMQTYKFA